MGAKRSGKIVLGVESVGFCYAQYYSDYVSIGLWYINTPFESATTEGEEIRRVMFESYLLGTVERHRRSSRGGRR